MEKAEYESHAAGRTHHFRDLS